MTYKIEPGIQGFEQDRYNYLVHSVYWVISLVHFNLNYIVLDFTFYYLTKITVMFRRILFRGEE